MKISLFPALLLIIATVAISYLVYDIAHSHSDSNGLIIGVGTGVSVFLTLGCVLGMSVEDDRINVNMKAWSIVAFIVIVVANFCFACLGFSMPCYFMVLPLILVTHLWVVWKLSVMKK